MVKRLTNPLADRDIPLGTLLGGAAQRLSTELDAALAQAGLSDVRSAHAPVFMAIDPEGTRATVLAERAHMTKQAMGEQLTHLVRAGYVTSAPDPTDGRARLFSLTARGWRAIDAAESVIEAFDRWLGDAVGDARVRSLRRTLETIIASDRATWS